MSENKDAIRDRLAEDIKAYFARGKVVKRYHYNAPNVSEPNVKYDLVTPRKPKKAK
tara:strand:+ start:191 stop:358 length:168 start_codon:yes stop_codon:yes gene_type:complete